MKRIYRVLLAGSLTGCLAVLSACHSIDRMTFENEKSGDRIELFMPSTIKNFAISTFHGTQVGSYSHRKVQLGMASGQFVWKGDTIDLRPPTSCTWAASGEQNRCATEGGTPLALEFIDGGSLRDSSGNIWKSANVKELAGIR